jgi:D-alanyl-D-alanine dipeptidase
MDAGAAFVKRVLAHPVEDDGEPLVDLPRAAERAGVEVAFSQTPFLPGTPRLFLVRAAVVEPLLAAAADLRADGCTLLVEDAFRTPAMQRELAVSDLILPRLLDALRRVEPGIDTETTIRRLAVVVAARPKGAGHMAGAAVDVSVLGPDGNVVPRGGDYPTVSELMPMDSPFATEEEAHNRRLVSDLMERNGFAAYPFEFWHFSLDDAFDRVARDDPRPARYGPIELLPDGHIAPVADQLAPLNADGELACLLESARREAPEA